MLKTKYIGKESFKTDEFHASPGNTVFMSKEQWDKLGEDQKLFERVSEDEKDFPKQSTRLPGWKEEGGEK
jgi:hypothetical protein